jgi:DNA-directed RNA polymerase specialized sigma24 family protein
VLERTLQRLLGPAAPLDALLESALVEALSSGSARPEPPSLLALQRIAAGVALSYLKSAPFSSAEQRERARRGSVRETLFHLHGWLRSSRAEEQLAFALLELSASPPLEVAAILRVSPTVVRQRAARIRRQLLFAARSDRLLARYLRLEPRLVALLRCWDRAALAAPASQRASRISAAVKLELEWFV